MGNIIDFESFKKRSCVLKKQRKKNAKEKMNKIRKDALFKDASILVSEVLSFVDRLERELK